MIKILKKLKVIFDDFLNKKTQNDLNENNKQMEKKINDFIILIKLKNNLSHP